MGANLGQRQQDVTSGEETSEEEDEEEEEEEDEPPRPKWQGIEAILEAYQEHLEGGYISWTSHGHYCGVGFPFGARTTFILLGMVLGDVCGNL